MENRCCAWPFWLLSVHRRAEGPSALPCPCPQQGSSAPDAVCSSHRQQWCLLCMDEAPLQKLPRVLKVAAEQLVDMGRFSAEMVLMGCCSMLSVHGSAAHLAPARQVLGSLRPSAVLHCRQWWTWHARCSLAPPGSTLHWGTWHNTHQVSGGLARGWGAGATGRIQRWALPQHAKTRVV